MEIPPIKSKLPVVLLVLAVVPKSVKFPGPERDIVFVVAEYHLCPFPDADAEYHTFPDSTPIAWSTVEAETAGYRISLEPTELVVNEGGEIPFWLNDKFAAVPVKKIFPFV